MTIGACELWRQDDHGNRFLVGRFATHAAAVQRMAELARVPHKQTYWIVVTGESGSRMEQQ